MPALSAFRRDNTILLLLTVGVSALAIASWALGVSSWLEAISFVTGAICVWLTVRQNHWNFPIGLANVATFSIVFFDAKLYADAGLQVVYFVLTSIGWYLWLYGGENRTKLSVTHASATELSMLVALLSMLTVGLWKTLSYVGGSASFWDALTTSMSLAAQWLLNRKKLESWVFWIVVDAIYVPLYVYKGLHLTAILYAVFLGMAVIGYKEWKASRA